MSGPHRRKAVVLAAWTLLGLALVEAPAAAQVEGEVVELDEASSADQDDPLAQAQASYSDVDFEATLRHARDALDRGGYGPSQVARIFELIGMAAAALEQDDLAREAYTRLLALDPDFELGDDLSPRFQGPFLEASGYWAAHPDRLGARVTLARARGALRIDVTDPLGMGRNLRVLARLEGELEYHERLEPIAEQTYFEVPGSREAQRVEYVVQILDRYDNRILEIGDEDAPEAIGRPAGSAEVVAQPAPTVEPRRSRAWLWAVIGVSAGVVVASVVATGVVLGIQAGQVGVRTSVDLGLSD
jgi:hypothetical protein